MSESRTDATLELARISLQTSGPLFEVERLRTAGRLSDARDVSQHLCDLLERQLALTEEFNRRFEPPHMEVTSIASSLVNAKLTLSGLLDALDDRSAAERVRAEADRLAAQYVPGDIVTRKRDLAGVRAAQNRYHEAITLLAEARDLLEARGDAIASAHVAAQLAETLEWLNDLQRAKVEAARAIALLEPMLPSAAPSMQDLLGALVGGNLEAAARNAEILKIWTQLAQIEARVSRELGDLDRARALFVEVRPRIPAVVHPAIDFHLARIEIQAGRTREGLSMLAAMEPLFTGMLRPKIGVLWTWQARGLMALGRNDEALAKVTPAIDDLRQRADYDALWRAQWTRARVLQALDRSEEAYAQLGGALQAIGALRHGTLGHRLDSTFLADKMPVYEAALELAVRSGRHGEAIRIIELVKARALAAILSLPRGGDVAVGAGEIDALSSELDQLEVAAYVTGFTEATIARRAELLARRAARIEKARIADPRWRSLSAPPAFDAAALSARLAVGRRAALSLYVREHDVFAVVVDGAGCLSGVRTLDETTRAALDAYRDSLAGQAAPVDPASLEGLALSSLVPAQVLTRALSATSIVIAPHGFFHLLPWPMLRCGEDRLFTMRPSSVVPSLTWLTQVPPASVGERAIALIGDPAYPRRGLRRLDLADDELHEIADIYGRDAVVGGGVVEGAAATEAAFRALAERPEARGAALHVVCHGDFVAEEPLYSGLLLADGKVDASEIARLPFRDREVVLSSCSSGYRASSVDGVPLTGDDIVGLVGAFLEAGASSVTVSITRARDDASHAFMTTYHRQRKSGSPPVRALQETQKAMITDGTYDPALWSGFVVYGS